MSFIPVIHLSVPFFPLFPVYVEASFYIQPRLQPNCFVAPKGYLFVLALDPFRRSGFLSVLPHPLGPAQGSFFLGPANSLFTLLPFFDRGLVLLNAGFLLRHLKLIVDRSEFQVFGRIRKICLSFGGTLTNSSSWVGTKRAQTQAQWHRGRLLMMGAIDDSY